MFPRSTRIAAMVSLAGMLWLRLPALAEGGTARHWAFEPVRNPAVPQVRENSWVASPIDAFVLAKIEANGLSPSPRAPKREWIRRVTFDLTGLPPEPAEVKEFLADDSPGAYGVVVERLLASPRYGERWARHWLDVARYADTKGYVRLNENPNYPGAWAYRDYVIHAFNEDKRYDRFILEQIAADRLMAAGHCGPESLAGMGFLTLGQRFINSQPDIIDDRIDVVTRGILGLTVACARCHDHKHDPIPSRDYYSLYGVFDSSTEPRVPPLTAEGRDLPAGYLEGFRKRANEFNAFIEEQRAKLSANFLSRADEYLLAAQKEKVQANFLAAMFLIDAAKDLNPVMVQRLGLFLDRTRKNHHPVMAVWHAVATLPEQDFPASAENLLSAFRGGTREGRPVNRVAVESLRTHSLRSLADAAQSFAQMLRQAEGRWQEARRTNPGAIGLDDPAWEEVRGLLHGEEAPFDVPTAEIEDFFYVDTTTQNRFHAEQRKVEDWISTNGIAPHAQMLLDAPAPREAHVFIRGNPANPGEAVPRQFLAALTRGERKPFREGSGRLELARAIAAEENPLTARVLVNRVWMHHFGAGLVGTPGDFGVRGERPTHPELLDYLAGRFMREGWSIKKLHRWIVLSSTYQQRGAATPELRRRDPANVFLSRMNPRRLDWESLRDSLLAVAGALDLRIGGPSVRLTSEPFSTRRTVYGFIDRQNLPGLFRTFDFASPDSCAPARHQTSVPQQSLFLMNSPFLREQAVRLAARVEKEAGATAEDRVNRLHWLLFGRQAGVTEVELAREFLAKAEKTPPPPPADAARWLTPWEEYAQALLLSNEFAFID